MKYIYITLIIAISILGTTSCVDDYILTPDIVGLDVNKVFSSAKNAEGAIALAYAYNLSSGLPVNTWSPPYMPYGTTEGYIGGEDLSDVSWTYEPALTSSGMTAAGPGSLNGAALSDDHFPFNYKYIRQACMVMENIDKVPDLTEADKVIIKGEMKGLIAFRHMEMLKRYGGVPLVDHSLTVLDYLERSSVQETVDFILRLCNEAEVLIGDHMWSNDWTGRFNRGILLAIKAETLTYAARPLFNTDKPYLDLSPNNQFICLGNYSEQRWQDAIKANLDVIEWGKLNGYVLIDTDNPFDDYGRAVGTVNSPEILLSYQQQGGGATTTGGGMLNMYSANPQKGGTVDCDYRGTSYEMLLNFHKNDGTDQTWAGTDTALPYQHYYDRAQEMEPRFKASIWCFGIDPWNNPGDQFWSVRSGWHMNKSTKNQGIGRNIKFWYKAGTRDWFEFPIYRMAEFYLNIAEGYNEIKDNSNALKYVNTIRNRGGLNDLTTTEYATLKNNIEREWAVEFYNENQFYPHARHWKKGDTMIGGPKNVFKFTYVAAAWGVRLPEDFRTYKLAPGMIGSYAWYDKMYLSPFNQEEVNKGYLVQNPGY